MIDIPSIFGVLGLGLLVVAARYDGRHRENTDIVTGTAGLDRALANVRHVRCDHGRRRAVDEDGFRMSRSKATSSPRRAGLIEHGRALRRGLAQMDRIELIELALVLHGAHAHGIGEDPRPLVGLDRIVGPTAFPQLVDHLHVVLGDIVAAVVPVLPFFTHALGGAVEIAGDDVPADAALGQMIERRHAPRERIRRLVGQRAGDAEAQMLRHMGHGRNEQARIVDGDLHGVFQRGIAVASIDVVDAEHVGQKQAVE